MTLSVICFKVATDFHEVAIQQNQPSTPFSFVALMAVLMSFVALSIDSMLPALGQIGRDLGVQDPNNNQWVISSVFLGMAVGLLFFGPWSDAHGRKQAIYLGMLTFAIGCALSMVTDSFAIMLVGRMLQGVGGASCRVVTVAMIRDRFSGNAMGKVMSLIMMVFILVPAVAPSIGQLVLFVASWREIFLLMLIMALLSSIWLRWGVRESLPLSRRRAFNWFNIVSGVKETLRHRASRGYLVAAGMVFGSFIGYLSSSQQILQIQYGLGDAFSLYFGLLALAIGSASFFNSRWVESVGMATLCIRALRMIVVLSVCFLPVAIYFEGHPPLIALMTYLLVSFFCFGILFGNFNALAIEPLGHIAGIANSVISSLQTVLSVILGGTIGYLYDQSVIPLVLGFTVLSAISLVLTLRIERAKGQLPL